MREPTQKGVESGRRQARSLIPARMFCCSSRDDSKKANNNATRNELHSGAPGNMPPANQTGKPVGVGIVFQPDSTGALHVKSLAVGGPAEKCGLVSVGDVLHEIDGHHVYRKPVAQLAPLILGQEGTVVRLGLQRGNLQRLVYVRALLHFANVCCVLTIRTRMPRILTDALIDMCWVSANQVELRRGWSMHPAPVQPAPSPAAAKWSHPLPQGAKLSHFSDQTGPTAPP